MYTKKEKPIVAQLFGSNPAKMREACALAASLGFDGIDINMGCPDRTIEKQGAGAATIKNPQLAKEIIKAAREGAPNLPVSVKTRIGYNKNEIETWIPELLKENLAALTVHLRTRKEMSDVPAHWDLMPQIVKLRNEISPETVLIGNGDVLDLKDAEKKIKESGCDGAMLGRAIFGNPWLFSGHIPTVEEKLKVMTEHTKLFEKLFKGIKNFAVMKKHYKAYSTGFDGAKDLRIKLMETVSAKEVERIVKDFLKNK
jgi:tRNA-dihydrouridine synthase